MSFPNIAISRINYRIPNLNVKLVSVFAEGKSDTVRRDAEDKVPRYPEAERRRSYPSRGAAAPYFYTPAYLLCITNHYTNHTSLITVNVFVHECAMIFGNHAPIAYIFSDLALDST